MIENTNENKSLNALIARSYDTFECVRTYVRLLVQHLHNNHYFDTYFRSRDFISTGKKDPIFSVYHKLHPYTCLQSAVVVKRKSNLANNRKNNIFLIRQFESISFYCRFLLRLNLSFSFSCYFISVPLFLTNFGCL